MIRWRNQNVFRSCLLSFLFLFVACVDNTDKTKTVAVNAKKNSQSEEKKSEAPLSIPGPNARELCQRPASISSSPETIEDVVRLLNAMPKPVSVPCFLDTLDAPFYINATSNQFSGQPAGESHSPRIFLFVGQALVISVVPTGIGAEMIEFSYRINAEESVKGELAFPVEETLALDAPYAHVIGRVAGETACMVCHYPERQAPEEFPSNAFASRWIGAIADYDVKVETLRKLSKTCESKEGAHCPVIQALFFRGPVYAKDFD